MKLFLIGFMGCGKSTLARKLSVKLGYHLVDLDQEIERSVGQRLTSYFEEHGEPAFRKLESEMLKTIEYPEDTVIATGGGTPCHFDNMDWMNEHGKTIYIDMPALALAKRLENGKAKRPLLKDLDEAAMVSFIENKLLERRPYYNKATVIVNGINLNADQLKELLSL